MPIVEYGVDQRAEAFLQSDGFVSLCYAMNAINTSSESETVNALACVALNDYVLNWAKGSSESYGMSIARVEDIRVVDDQRASRGRGYPQLDTQGGRIVEQITIHTGESTLSTYQFPAHSVVEDSARTIAARLEKVNARFGALRPDMVDSVLLRVHRGGQLSYYERPNRGNWTYMKRLSSEIGDMIDHSALLSALARVS